MVSRRTRGGIARAAITAALTGTMALGSMIAPVGIAFAGDDPVQTGSGTDSTGGSNTEGGKESATKVVYEEQPKVSFVSSDGKPAEVFAWQIFKAEVSAEKVTEKGTAGAADKEVLTGNSVAKNVEWSSPKMQTIVMNYINGDGNYTGWLTKNSLTESTENVLRYISEQIDADRASGFSYKQDLETSTSPEIDTDEYNVVASDSFAQKLAQAILDSKEPAKTWTTTTGTGDSTVTTTKDTTTEIDATPTTSGTGASATTTRNQNEGYWLVLESVSTTEGEGDEATIKKTPSLGSPMWIPVGGTVGHVTIKSLESTITKYVTDDDSAEGTEEKVADVEFGKELTFKLVVTLPKDGPKTAFEITDTLPAGMELTGVNIDESTGVVTNDGDKGIKILTSKDTKDADGTVTVSKLDVGDFNIKFDKTKNTLTLTAKSGEEGLDKIAALNESGDTDLNTVSVVYTATLKAGATKGIANPNENAAKLNVDDTVTEESIARVYTYQLRIDKVDGEGNPLTGAKFTIQDMGNGKYVEGAGTTRSVAANENPPVIAMDEFSNFTIPYLDEGTYKITEVGTPKEHTYDKPTDADYFTLEVKANRNNDVIDGLTATADANPDSKLLTAVINADATDADSGLIVVTVTNGDSQILLPVTGMTPNQLGTLIGALLVATGAIVVIVRRRQSENA